MKAYWIKSPKWLSLIFKKRIWHFSPQKKIIYLTFDDGPTRVTSFVLEQLKQYDAKATFFCIGDNVDKYPLIFNRLKDEGHSIGNHTQHHINGWKTNSQAYFENVMFLDQKLYTGSNANTQKLFRPPYGKCTKAQRKLLYKKAYKIIMWSVLSADFDTSVSKEKCLNNVLKNTRNGSIILFHDSLKSEEKLRYALPKVLEHFSKQGYIFRGIDSLTQ